MTITASQWLTFFPDDFGLSGWEKSIVVGSIAPEITSFAAPTEPMSIDVAVGAVGTFVDANQADGHVVTIDWGDGTGLETISEVSYEDTGDGVFEGTVNPSHLYLEPGVYRLTLSVTDDCGEIMSLSYEYVVVYDPDGGFVTGGGWIESPEGAYAPDPTLTGAANFGFVSKYKKGAHVPTGNTEFQFHAGDLNFHSSEYDWLVVAGAKAMFKGTGTINGDGEYGFMISAIDAAKTPSTDVDLFRIKIWDNETEEIVYDNQMGDDEDADATTEIAAGNIVVHDGKRAK
jgi:PKD repeat protein